MANKRPRDLTAIASLATTDVMVVEDISEPTSTEVRKATMSAISTFVTSQPNTMINQNINLDDNTLTQDIPILGQFLRDNGAQFRPSDIEPLDLANAKWKEPVRVATTAAGTLASDFENGDTVDGITLATGNRILLKDQTDGSENGIYAVQASGAPIRERDFNDSGHAEAAVVMVRQGTVNAQKQFYVTTTGSITIGSTPITFASHLHSHTDISDFDAGVQANRLDQMAAPTANLSINSNKLTNVTDGTAAQDAATKSQVDVISPVGLQEQWIPAGAWGTVTTNGAEFAELELGTNDIMLQTFNFDTTTSEKIQCWWTPPNNWDAGTIKFKLYWTNAAGLTTETIDFDLAGYAYADSDAIDTALGTPQNVTDTWLAQNDMHITAYSSAITLGGTPTAGEPILLQLSRDVVSDNMTGDVKVIGVMIQFTIDASVTT
jgi:hypothetical protein